jgi:hypothetical protein
MTIMMFKGDNNSLRIWYINSFSFFSLFYLKHMHSLPIISFESDMLGQPKLLKSQSTEKQNIRPGSFLSEIKQSELPNVEASKCCFLRAILVASTGTSTH